MSEAWSPLGDRAAPDDAAEGLAPRVLAVDLGLRTGLAAFAADGTLCWARTTHLPDRATLKRAIGGILKGLPTVTHLVCEGDKALASLWRKAADRRRWTSRSVTPETWRAVTLLPRERRSAVDAKRAAIRYARAIAIESGIRPITLGDDAAEAILIGRWAIDVLGWPDPG